MVDGLRGKNVVSVVAGGEHSSAITEDGALYTWGKGSYGRLGHGENWGRAISEFCKNTFMFILCKKRTYLLGATCTLNRSFVRWKYECVGV